jgi:heme exporter protein C
MDKSMLIPFGWNVLAWLSWGILLLILRHHVERRQQKILAVEAEEALNASN